MTFGRSRTGRTAIVSDAFLGTEDHDLSGLIDGLNRTTEGLGRNEDQLKSLVTSFNTTVAATASQAANLRARAELMRQIAEVVKEGGWTQVDAATHCGISQPRINDLLRGRVSRFSIDALVNIATALGRTVHFELQAA
mgnify:CR=1 FL=1